jgi:hypothetical protein
MTCQTIGIDFCVINSKYFKIAIFDTCGVDHMAKSLDIYTMDFYIICHKHTNNISSENRFNLIEYLDKWCDKIAHVGDKFTTLGLSHNLTDDHAPSFTGLIIKTTDSRQNIIDCVLSSILANFSPKIPTTIKSLSKKSITNNDYFPKLILSIN